MNKTKAIKNITSGYGIGVIISKKEQVLNLNIETENMVSYKIISLNGSNEGSNNLGTESTIFKRASKNIKCGNNREIYIVIIEKKDDTTMGDNESNSYTIEKKYDGII